MSTAESTVAASRALDDLYRSHAGEVYRYAYAVLGNHADAEDVMQTTFVNALSALERGERPRKPSNWLITITHNIVRQRFRQQQARPIEVELNRDVVAQEAADNSGPSIEELVRGLQRLPQSQREALVLRELEGRSYNEISQILDLSKSALETLLFRARRSLADELENAATCGQAELDFSRQLDGRLSRKERKRLDDHIAGCPSCKRLQEAQGRRRRAFKGLALLPLPLSLTMFKGAPTASAATGQPTIGAAGTAVVVSGSPATGAGGAAALSGLALGGVALKAVAVVAAVSVASGVGYVGTKEVQSYYDPAKKSPVTAGTLAPAKPHPTNAGGTQPNAGGTQRSEATTTRSKASAEGSSGAAFPTGSSRIATASGQPGSAPGRAKLTQTRVAKRTSHPAQPAGIRTSSPRATKAVAKPKTSDVKAATTMPRKASRPTARQESGPATRSAKTSGVSDNTRSALTRPAGRRTVRPRRGHPPCSRPRVRFADHCGPKQVIARASRRSRPRHHAEVAENRLVVPRSRGSRGGTRKLRPIPASSGMNPMQGDHDAVQDARRDRRYRDARCLRCDGGSAHREEHGQARTDRKRLQTEGFGHPDRLDHSP